MKPKTFEDNSGIAFGVFLYIIIIATFLGCGLLFGHAQCKRQATALGFNYDWGPVKGCLIEVDSNKWIPLSSYRYFGE